MPRKLRETKRRVGVLTRNQEMELILGPAGHRSRAHRAPHIGELPCDQFCWSWFTDEEHRRLAWFAHRQTLHSEGPEANGIRRWGWWRYEARTHCRHRPRCPVPRRLEDRTAWLAYHGVLDASELAWLQAAEDLGARYREQAELLREAVASRAAAGDREKGIGSLEELRQLTPLDETLGTCSTGEVRR